MSNSSNNFDFRELADDLIGLVKNRAKDAAASPVKPDSEHAKTAVLSSIATEPNNAADIARAITLTSAGTWKPTAGEIQKALTELEEEKMVSAKLEGDRKVYSITKAGKTHLKAIAEEPQVEHSSPSESKFSSNLLGCKPEFLRAASKLAPAMMDIAQTGSSEQQAAAATVLEVTRHKLHQILAEK